MRKTDVPILRAMAQSSGWPYPELNDERLEEILVVVDDDERPVMAAAAERLVQLYLWCGEFTRPHAKIFALRLLHESMSERLKSKGYTSAEAFVPPQISNGFARRLERTFGWIRNWPSWTHSL